jgi:hypothetical protein
MAPSISSGPQKLQIVYVERLTIVHIWVHIINLNFTLKA